MIHYRGVWYDPKRNKYRAACKCHGRSILIGRFNTLKRAAHAYDLKAKQLWGEQAILNFSNWNRATPFQLKCYKLCSPDFDGLTQRQAGVVLNVKNSVVCVALRRLKKKCPILFPIYRTHGKILRYEPWQDFNVKRKF